MIAGKLEVTDGGKETDVLEADGYAYYPASVIMKDHGLQNAQDNPTEVFMYKKRYQPLKATRPTR